MKNKESYVLVLGASIIDIFGLSNRQLRCYDSNPGKVKVSLGGVCRNIAENLCRIGVNTEFISVLGNDEMGKRVLSNAEEIGYNMSNSLILEDVSTPTYMAILDDSGEMVSAIVDMKSLDMIDTGFIDSKAEVIENSEYTCLDTDNPEILEYIVTKFSGKTKFILDPVSANKAQHIKHLVKHFHTIKPNRIEAEALCGFKLETMADIERAAQYFLSLGVEKVFISLDEDGIYYADANECGTLKSSAVKVVNVTGAGDSFVAGICYGYMNGLSMKETVRYAMAMSIIAISHEETIHPEMCLDLVEDYIKETIWI